MTQKQVKLKMAMDRAKALFEKDLIPMLVGNYRKGIIDFKLRIDSPTHFYIHPDGVDGETIDINWGGETASYSHDFNETHSPENVQATEPEVKNKP